jgi:N-acetylglucosamine-6-sulfatase
MAVDEGVGAIFDTLRATGQLDETFVFFTSDNGYFFGEHRFTSGKSLPYEPAARVPLAVRGPGVPRGRKASRLTSTMDIGATALALTGTTPSFEVDGQSLKPIWRGTAGPSNRGVLVSLNRTASVTDEGTDPFFLGRARPPTLGFDAIRIGPYKYVEYENGDSELYDLSRDKWELTNRAEVPRWSPVLAYMAAQLDLLRDCSGSECRQDLPAWPEPEPLDRSR